MGIWYEGGEPDMETCNAFGWQWNEQELKWVEYTVEVYTVLFYNPDSLLNTLDDREFFEKMSKKKKGNFPRRTDSHTKSN